VIVLDHSYEEIRNAVVGVLLADVPHNERVESWESLKAATAAHVARLDGRPIPASADLSPADAELVRDVFWDLFRQGHVTLGSNNHNPNWPCFRLSHFGQSALRGNDPYKFTDSSSYVDMIRAQVESLDPTSELYLSEAVRAFYAGCLLSSVVMLGVAAESRFLRVVDAAIKSQAHGAVFKSVGEERTLLRKIIKFQNLMTQHGKAFLGRVGEDLDTNLMFIQSVVRTSRNEAGHPTGKPADRAQTYVLLQLFAPLAKRLEQLEKAFS
jgi:hypothetical protein